MNKINTPIPANYSGSMLFDLITRWETWIIEYGEIEGNPFGGPPFFTTFIEHQHRKARGRKEEDQSAQGMAHSTNDVASKDAQIKASGDESFKHS
eukprot:scaffold37782_cov156-Skeletonema_marinoi.AAC.1